MVHTLLNINELNSCDFNTFVGFLQNVNEIGTLSAAVIWKWRPFKNLNHLFEKICEFIDQLPISGKEGVLRLHSSVLQRLINDDDELRGTEFMAVSVGNFKPEIKQKIESLNEMYQKKFGFPYVVCVRHLKNETFVSKLEQRLKHSLEEEVETSIMEMKKITYLRLAAIVEHDVLELKL